MTLKENGQILKVLEIKYESNSRDFANAIVEMVGIPDDFDFVE